MRGPTAPIPLSDDRANFNISGVLGIAFTVVAAIVGVILLANLIGSYASGVGGLSENISTSDWGDDTANSLAPTFGMLISLGGLFAIVGLGFIAYKLKA